MPTVNPQPKTEGDRVLLLEAAVQDLQQSRLDFQQWRLNRQNRDEWLVGTLVATVVGVLGIAATLILAYVHP